jgi:tryptophanyl-tRNA synthetase
MASDILLYKANIVPVGEDQKQHLELTRKYAERFNSIVGREFFPCPAYSVAKVPKVMSLVDPTKKMSKSDKNERSCINLSDTKTVIAEKIRRAVTDCEGLSVSYETERRPGLANLIHIYSVLSSK